MHEQSIRNKDSKNTWLIMSGFTVMSEYLHYAKPNGQMTKWTKQATNERTKVWRHRAKESTHMRLLNTNVSNYVWIVDWSTEWAKLCVKVNNKAKQTTPHHTTPNRNELNATNTPTTDLNRRVFRVQGDLCKSTKTLKWTSTRWSEKTVWHWAPSTEHSV